MSSQSARHSQRRVQAQVAQAAVDTINRSHHCRNLHITGGYSGG
jgi:hypothetical protein